MRNGNKFTMNTPNTETLRDLLSQLGGILGVGRRSDGKFYLADMCTASSINQWAYKKPIKANTQANLTDAERLQAKHGLVQNSSTFYIEYDRVTSGWWKRLRDFNGYNHAATPPIRDTSAFNKTLSFSGGSSGQIVLNTNAFANPGSEIPLNEIAVFQTYANWYVGMMLYNKTSGKGYYQTTEWTLNQYINGEASSGIPLLMEAEAPNIEDGVTYDFYYCLSMNKNVSYRAFSRSDIGSSLYVLCCDATHGHASVKAVKMGWKYIKIVKPDNAYSDYRGYGAANIYIPTVTIRCSWNFTSNPYTDEKMTLQVRIGDQGEGLLTSQELTLRAETVFRFSGSGYISESAIVDQYEYIVPITIFGKLGSESSYRTLATCSLDVRSDELLYWGTYL